ncbi:NAD-binding protein [uncultured Brachyspira sp.]|uniref:NAD-binding protein n=1 Tax=uncultured Brachyspira sp. TaxID=221953 RepID=UPI002626C595|nr:NAD-binding protein [uncultured Brachyspira sp.]
MNHPITIYISDLSNDVDKEKILESFAYIINHLRRIYPKRLVKLYTTLYTDTEIAISKLAIEYQIVIDIITQNKIEKDNKDIDFILKKANSSFVIDENITNKELISLISHKTDISIFITDNNINIENYINTNYKKNYNIPTLLFENYYKNPFILNIDVNKNLDDIKKNLLNNINSDICSKIIGEKIYKKASYFSMTVAWVISFIFISILGIIAWKDFCLTEYNEDISILTALYKTLQIFQLEASFDMEQLPPLLNIIRFLAPITLAGALFQMLKNLFSDLITRTIISIFFKNHTIICGCNTKSLCVLNGISKDKKIVLICDEDEIDSKDIFNKKVLKLKGDYTQPSTLFNAGILKCNEIFCISENDDKNIETMSIASKIIRTYKINHNIELTVDIEDNNKYKNYEKIKPISYDGDPVYIKFSSFKKNAIRLFIDNIAKYSVIRNIHINEGKEPIILIFGVNNNVIEIIRELILLVVGKDNNINLIFVDKNQEFYNNVLINKLPELSRVANLHFLDYPSFINNEIPENIAKLLEKLSSCLIYAENEENSLNWAIETRQILFKNLSLKDEPKIFVYLDSKTNILEANPELYNKYYKVGIDIFASMNYLSSIDYSLQYDDLDIIAKKIHSEYCKMPTANNNLIWNSLSEGEKNDNRYAARFLNIKLDYIGLSILDFNDKRKHTPLKEIMDIDLLRRLEHKRWYVSKILSGFDSISSNYTKETLNFIKTHMRLHNLLVPFDELSNEELYKDSMGLIDIPIAINNEEYQMIIEDLNDNDKEFVTKYYILDDNSTNRSLSTDFIVNYDLLDKMRDILFNNKKLNSFIKYKIGKNY